MPDVAIGNAAALHHTAGQRLRAAREAAGLSLADMSLQSKIPARMLELIESGNYAALPARTYATGFTRSYARLLGLNEKELVAQVRAELGLNEPVEPRLAATFEPGDPARVPTARFAWLAAVAALVVVAAGMLLWRTYYSPAVTLPPITPEASAPAFAPPAPPPDILPTAAPAPGAAAAGVASAPGLRTAPAAGSAGAAALSAPPVAAQSPQAAAPAAPQPAPADGSTQASTVRN
jgi:cytoskeletal protein RodZ